MVKAIFFDFDGVLTLDRTGSVTTTRYISKATGIDDRRVKAAFARFNDDLTRGKCTHAEIWPEICRDLGANVDIAVLEDAFASTPLNHEMFALARQLSKHHVVGMITDNKQDRMDCLERLHCLSSYFHPVVVSAAIGATKTDRAIFERALELVHIDASECVFIDNALRNLAVPRAMGMIGIHFDDAANDVPRLIHELLGVDFSGTMLACL
jgi:putative hydrolase of the HAD superfamily